MTQLPKNKNLEELYRRLGINVFMYHELQSQLESIQIEHEQLLKEIKEEFRNGEFNDKDIRQSK